MVENNEGLRFAVENCSVEAGVRHTDGHTMDADALALEARARRGSEWRRIEGIPARLGRLKLTEPIDQIER